METLPIKISKKLIIAIGVAFAVFVLLMSTFSYLNNLQKGTVQREIRLSRQYESLKSGLDAFLSTAREQAGVTKAQSAAFDKIMLDAVQGRYQGKEGQPTGAVPGTGGTLFSAIAEAYPNLDSLNSSYSRIIDTISSGRAAFNNNQQKLQDQIREYDQFRKSGIIRSWVIGHITGAPTDNLVVVNAGRKTRNDAYEVMTHVIASGVTANAFESGKLESQDFFGN